MLVWIIYSAVQPNSPSGEGGRDWGREKKYYKRKQLEEKWIITERRTDWRYIPLKWRTEKLITVMIVWPLERQMKQYHTAAIRGTWPKLIWENEFCKYLICSNAGDRLLEEKLTREVKQLGGRWDTRVGKKKKRGRKERELKEEGLWNTIQSYLNVSGTSAHKLSSKFPLFTCANKHGSQACF